MSLKLSHGCWFMLMSPFVRKSGAVDGEMWQQRHPASRDGSRVMSQQQQQQQQPQTNQQKCVLVNLKALGPPGSIPNQVSSVLNQNSYGRIWLKPSNLKHDFVHFLATDTFVSTGLLLKSIL